LLTVGVQMILDFLAARFSDMAYATVARNLSHKLSNSNSVPKISRKCSKSNFFHGCEI
jgi:hypothetical protein